MQGERGLDGWRESDRGEKMTEEGATMGSLWWGDCVTERKVHCCVCNALKTDIKTHCPTHTVTAPLSPFLLYSPPFCSLSGH